MTTINRDIVSGVLVALMNDTTLAEYVKSFSAGEQDTAKKLFPFITIGNLRYQLLARDTANDTYVYTVEVVAGTRSLARGVAYEGDKTGRKGIIQLCEDIVGVVRTNTFNGLFASPISDIRYRLADKPDSGGAIWQGIITFTGERLVRR
jgi:hypothetical protein